MTLFVGLGEWMQNFNDIFMALKVIFVTQKDTNLEKI